MSAGGKAMIPALQMRMSRRGVRESISFAPDRTEDREARSSEMKVDCTDGNLVLRVLDKTSAREEDRPVKMM